jgi:hypothetical protein
MIILYILLSLIAVILILPLIMRKVHHVERSIVISVPAERAFDFLKMIGNHDQFNKWAGADPGRKEEFKGSDGTVGYIYSWSGNKEAGQGEKEIKVIDPLLSD